MRGWGSLANNYSCGTFVMAAMAIPMRWEVCTIRKPIEHAIWRR